MGFRCDEGEKLLFHVQCAAQSLIAALVEGFSKPDDIHQRSNKQEVVENNVPDYSSIYLLYLLPPIYPELCRRRGSAGREKKEMSRPAVVPSSEKVLCKDVFLVMIQQTKLKDNVTKTTLVQFQPQI